MREDRDELGSKRRVRPDGPREGMPGSGDARSGPSSGRPYTAHAGTLLERPHTTSQVEPSLRDGEVRHASDSSFAARFGRAIVQHGIAAIPSALFHYQGSLDLSAQEVWFISYVMCFKWDENLPRVNLSQMEKRVGMGKRSLYRLKERLCEAEYLKVFPVYTDNGRQESSAYDFSGLFEQIERLILADPPRSNPIHTDEPEGGETDDEPAERDMSFLARFGRVIARYGVAAVPQATFTYQAALGLKPQQVWFISYIFSYQWKKALPYPSIVKMSARTGYSTVQLHEIKASLVDLGYLKLVQRSTSSGGRDSNAYDFSGLFDAIRAQLQQEHAQSKAASARHAIQAVEPVGRARPSRRRGRAAAQSLSTAKRVAEGDSRLAYRGDSDLTGEGGAQLLYRGDSELIWGGGSKQTMVGGEQLSEEGDSNLSWEGDPRLSAHMNKVPPTRVTRSLHKRVTQSLHNVESKEEEKQLIEENDSNHHSKEKKISRNDKLTTPSRSSLYIVSLMDDFSNELNDWEHKTSNSTQALRIWEASGKTEADFIQLIFGAKQVTRKYQGKNGTRGIENKMAYFFAVLRDLSGLREDSPQASLAFPQAPSTALEPQRRKTASAEPDATISARQLWQAALAELQTIVPPASFQTWLKNTSIAAFSGKVVVVAVPSSFSQEWLEKRFKRQIAETLTNVIGYAVDVRFEVKPPAGPLAHPAQD